MKTEEIWKPIKGYETKYIISNRGNVKRLNKYMIKRNGVKHKYKSDIVSCHIDNYGYKRISLNNGSKAKMFRLHRLIYEAFVGELINKLQVDHIDNNRLNNDISNLQQITNRENCSKDRNGVSKHTGVTWHKTNKKWQALIFSNGKSHHLGYYKDEHKAHLAYQKALSEVKEKQQTK